MYYYESRYYDPLLKRFTSVDPWGGDIGDPQSVNKYSYVRNTPVMLVDPSGESFMNSLSREFNTLEKNGYSVWPKANHDVELLQVVYEDGPRGVADGILFDVLPDPKYDSKDKEAIYKGFVDSGEAISILGGGSGAAKGVIGKGVKGLVKKESVKTVDEINLPQSITEDLVNTKIYKQLEKQLSSNGPDSIAKSLNSAKKTLQEHIDKLPSLQYKSQVEGTIKNVNSQIKTLEKFIKDNNIILKK